MNQKLSIGLLFGGLATFLTTLGEFVSSHNTWRELSGPHEIGTIAIITGSFIFTIFGALGTKLPRKKNSRVGDRVPKEDILVTQIEELREDKEDKNNEN